MKYVPYEDSRRKNEYIMHGTYLGKTTRQLAEEMETSQQDVSYYKRKLGLSRPRLPSRKGIPLCVVCRQRPVSDSIPRVCGDSACLGIYLDTVQCANSLMAMIGGKMVRASTEEKIAIDIQPFLIFNPPKEARVCILGGVTRLLYSLADHIKYHGFCLLHKPKKPPVAIWVNESEKRLHDTLVRTAKRSKTNLNSEDLQPEREDRNLPKK